MTPAAVAVSCVALLPVLAHAAGDEADTLRALRAEAHSYEHGEGVPKDPYRAVELYCKAAAEGDAEAQYDLGWMYLNGRGVPRNEPYAAALFGLAAEQGLAQAQTLAEKLPAATPDLPGCLRVPVTAQYDDQQVILAAPALPSLEDDLAQFVPRNEAQEKITRMVQALSPQYNVSPLLALAFIRAESNFDPRATSPKNAQGLMQLIPETSARFNVHKPYDPTQNIRGGLAYLRWLLAYFRGNVPLVAAAYNAGEKTVERYRGIPPYAETRQYVRRILQVFRHRHHPFDAAVTEASPVLPVLQAEDSQ